MKPQRHRKPVRATPRGAAQQALEDTRLSLQDLEQAANSDPVIFRTRMNAFVRSARSVPQILRKELGRNASWVSDNEEKLIAADPRYAYFKATRDDPAHHEIIQTQEQKLVEVIERMPMRGSVEVDLRDAATGNIVARAYHCAPVDADSGVFESTRVSRAYFLKGWNEDAFSFCNHVLTTLGDLVSRASQEFP
jgi:hypothetical protein